ncbi:MAG: hypothetical protein HY912_12390 [Desulfomonile tiedjei]|uniref:Uncharacterized protein n=1 Tax=Desulfomonile tiedjei TaxID=2358 RepID=A0A9D6V466_9BACT|nr:hypothetical protein [Desulfomonile tiedjei]
MLVRFWRGIIRKTSKEIRAFWAESDFGITVFIQGGEFVQSGEPYEIAAGELMTSLELPGLEREDIEFLIQRILEGGYLEKPGVKGKGDAILYMLVNEALHTLTKLSDVDLP